MCSTNAEIKTLHQDCKSQGDENNREARSWEAEKEFTAMQGLLKLFSICFRYPDDKVYEVLQQNRNILQSLAEEQGDGDFRLPGQQELEAEFVALFVNNKGFVPVVPYASYYLQEDGLLFGPEVKELSRMMQDVGLEIKDDITEPPDHIYLLLELCAEIAGVLASEKDYRKCGCFLVFQNLLSNYLSPMLEGFVQAISNHAGLRFYQLMGRSLQDYITFQANLYQEIPG